MKEILSFVGEYLESIGELDKNLSDNELLEIYNGTTEEENKQYNKIINEYLDTQKIPPVQYDLVQAVSFIYLKCHLLEEKII